MQRSVFFIEAKIMKNENGEVETLEINVYDYFVNHRNIQFRYSTNMPCINIGNPKRPTYIPLASLQRNTKALSTFQRASLVKKSRQKPQERISVLSNSIQNNNYGAKPMLRSCNVSISYNFTQVDGHILSTPRLRVGNGEDFFPRNGQWNLNNKKLMEPSRIERWAFVNSLARCDKTNLAHDLIRCGEMKGICIDPSFDVFQEMNQNKHLLHVVRMRNVQRYPI
ncbi:hypothetical protein REPUB_Repub20aG0076300 [Reevesia pubescens]